MTIKSTPAELPRDAAMSATGRDSILRYEKSLDCIHCGLCLSKCPTYRLTGNEAASPRGRVYLMRGLAEGRLEISDAVHDQMNMCLVCRACETACPSGVEFGRMMEITRDELGRTSRRRGFGAWLGGRFRRWMLNRVVPSPRMLGVVAFMTRAYRRSGLRRLVHGLRLTKIMPHTLRTMEANLPDVPPRRDRRRLPMETTAKTNARTSTKTSGGLLEESSDVRRGRVAVLEGCVMPMLFGNVNRRVVDALAHQGFDVVSPKTQTCCGALHAHAGDMAMARDLARRNIEAFEAADVEYVVLDSAGCGAALADYGHWFEHDDAWRDRARAVSAKVIDVLALFAKLDLIPRGRGDIVDDAGLTATRTATAYDAPCHLHHGQRETSSPLDVVRRIPGLDLVPLEGSEDCCGAAGIYNITHPEESAAILAEKLDRLERSGARLLLTGNPGCLLQWRKGIAERGLDVEVRHPGEFL